MSEARDLQDDMPAASWEADLWAAQALALAEVLGPKKGRRFVEAMAQRVMTAAAQAETIPLRAPQGWAAMRDSKRAAAAYFRRFAPGLLAATWKAR